MSAVAWANERTAGTSVQDNAVCTCEVRTGKKQEGQQQNFPKRDSG